MKSQAPRAAKEAPNEIPVIWVAELEVVVGLVLDPADVPVEETSAVAEDAAAEAEVGATEAVEGSDASALARNWPAVWVPAISGVRDRLGNTAITTYRLVQD